jgi:hypothetical protein
VLLLLLLLLLFVVVVSPLPLTRAPWLLQPHSLSATLEPTRPRWLGKHHQHHQLLLLLLLQAHCQSSKSCQK